mgnify:CR=1 FL=1
MYFDLVLILLFSICIVIIRRFGIYAQIPKVP